MDYGELYLAHHGIKGQKWGIRRYQNEDGSYTDAGMERYTVKQYSRDADVYGKTAATRIQKHIVKDPYATVSGERSKEAARIEGFRESSRVGKHVGKALGGAIGGVGAGLVSATQVSKLLSKIGVNNSTVSNIVTVAAAAGGAVVGEALGGIAGKSLPMIVGGYSPTKAK